MRKVISLALALAMICSMSTVSFALAADHGNWEGGTEVTYVGSSTTVDDKGTEDKSDDTETYDTPWTVIVPETMAPGGSDEVVATGEFPSTMSLIVDADDTVAMVHTLGGVAGGDDKTLTVTFNGIDLSGDNEVEVTQTVEISVQDMTDALYGQWAGHFYYDVELG